MRVCKFHTTPKNCEEINTVLHEGGKNSANPLTRRSNGRPTVVTPTYSGRGGEAGGKAVGVHWFEGRNRSTTYLTTCQQRIMTRTNTRKHFCDNSHN